MGDISPIQRMQVRYYGWQLPHPLHNNSTGDTSNLGYSPMLTTFRLPKYYQWYIVAFFAYANM